jgi:hypothetical protein
VEAKHNAAVAELADELVLGALLERVRFRWDSFELVDHWQQGEFHHDTVLRVRRSAELPGSILVVATNCNGGVKEVLCCELLMPNARSEYLEQFRERQCGGGWLQRKRALAD